LFDIGGRPMFRLALCLFVFFCFHVEARAGSPAGDKTSPTLDPTAAMQNNSSDISAFWVGHSLVEQRTPSEWGDVDLPTLVGLFAKDRGLKYRAQLHALWGSPLSALWRGKPHSYARDASEMVAKREAFERDAGSFNTMVLTEALPVSRTRGTEYSAYYLRQFYCALKRSNPSARVYLFQTWVNLQGGDPGAGYSAMERFDWSAEMAKEQLAWAELATAAVQPKVRQPSFLDRLGWVSITDSVCPATDAIDVIPVGDVLRTLNQRLKQPGDADAFRKPDGKLFSLSDLFQNPYLNWPDRWPLKAADDAASVEKEKSELVLKDPSKSHDDIHSSLAGIYVSALTHFSVLYGQSPVGLRYPSELGHKLAQTLQCIVWDVVNKGGAVDDASQADCSVGRAPPT
jgi:hypothetical protein